ncbi:hypothetical protein C9I98_01420 [Photobacterium sanctipauli]|uniref:Acyltransferase 3 domain-containing protein n=2 Tax=Photobacterium sanctipauli TaxID=1342794 RepID=A0A2T3P0A6_9GAMM|nr:acyltransferase family protein [Photobacterium sanctipauli]PSW21951.1 hypothetical protein C9I98_01420 [Photobacterium sanctipauli]
MPGHSNIERFHYLDAMRAILMMLGVVIHSANVYSPIQGWLIYNPETLYLAGLSADIITSFRMPAFFVVAGFFCYLTLTKYSATKFLKFRLKRIIIPFIATAIILNSVQAFILFKTGWLDTNIKNYVLNGEYISHLWFLVNLTSYFIFSAFFYSIRHIFPARKSINITISPVLIFFTLPFLHIIILSLNKTGIPIYDDIMGLTSIYSLLKYLPFFIFGIYICYNKKIIDVIIKTKTQTYLFTVTAITTINILFIREADSLINNITSTYFGYLLQWALVFLCFKLFYIAFNKQSNTFLYLSNASYTVYLFHHIIVVILGLMFIQYNVPPMIGFPTLILSTIAITLWIHSNIISKNKYASLAFNGR